MLTIKRIVVSLAIVAAACASQAATLLYQNNNQVDVGASMYYPAVMKDSNTLSYANGIKITVSLWELRYVQPSHVTLQIISASTQAVLESRSISTLNSSETTYTWNTSGRMTPYYVRIKASCMQTLGGNYTHTLNKTFKIETRP